MGVEENAGTPPDEVLRDQLSKMLEAPQFCGSAVYVRLLKYLVDSALAGKALTQDVVGYDVFPDQYKSDESGIVRVNCNALRKRLADYYKTNGKDDIVVFDFRKGRSYKVHFQYSATSDAAQKCRTIRNDLLSQYPVGNVYRRLALESVIARAPAYAPAHVCLAECCLWAAVDNSQHWKAFQLLKDAHSSINTAISLSPDSWFAYVVLGAISVCQQEWDCAAQSFDEALILAPLKTRINHYYAAYLFSLGRLSEGLGLVRSNALENPQDTLTQAIYGLFLMAAGKLSEAREVLEREINGGKNHRLAPVFLAFIKISPHKYWKNPKTEAERYASDTFFYVQRKNRLNDDDLFDLNGPFDLPTNALDAGAAIHVACENFNPDIETGESVILNGFNSVSFCRGVLSYCHAKIGDEDGAVDLMSGLCADGDFFQKALGAYGLVEIVETIISLAKAAENHEPLLAWLHLWPIFDPIRHHPAFQELLENLGLPPNDVIRYIPCVRN